MTQADYMYLRVCLFFLPHYSLFQGLLLFFPQLNMTAGFLCSKPVRIMVGGSVYPNFPLSFILFLLRICAFFHLAFRAIAIKLYVRLYFAQPLSNF